MLDSLLNRRIGLSIRKDVLLYWQLSHSKMDYATGATSYISNRQIHEDLGVPFFGDNVRALIESFD